MALANGKDERIKQWISRMPTVAAQVKDAKQLLDGKLGEEEAALVGFALVQEMNGKGTRKQFDGLLRALRKGDSFEEAMGKTFGPPEAFLNA